MPSWGDLNKRQQTYLQAVYEVDQAQEANIKLGGARGRWKSTPASEWRWRAYKASGAALLRRIPEAGHREGGTGSTLAPPEGRRLVPLQHGASSLGGARRFT